ncbi:MAG TPA: hypothetical protein VJJ79_00275 [Candidatus Nanoarchaeia archaeon]|nr:hypothetical protein [Candidatus Nanoarchaeia archaeon]
MSEKEGGLEKSLGYEVTVSHPNGQTYVLCVDTERKIRGWYLDGYRRYLSDWELWNHKDGLGILKGELQQGKSVLVDENIFTANGNTAEAYLVIRVEEVDIEEMTKYHYIAGLDYPIFLPEYEN